MKLAALGFLIFWVIFLSYIGCVSLQKFIESFYRMMRDIGMLIAVERMLRPTQVLEYLILILDFVKQQFGIPKKNRQKCLNLVGLIVPFSFLIWMSRKGPLSFVSPSNWSASNGSCSSTHDSFPNPACNGTESVIRVFPHDSFHLTVLILETIF